MYKYTSATQYVAADQRRDGTQGGTGVATAGLSVSNISENKNKNRIQSEDTSSTSTTL